MVAGLLIALKIIGKILFTAVKITAKILAFMITYLGMWVPVLYLAVIAALIIFGGLNLSVPGTDTVLFYVGLTMSFLAAIMLTVRSYIVKPIVISLGERRKNGK